MLRLPRILGKPGGGSLTCVMLRVGRLVDRRGHVFVLALDGDEERVWSRGICRDRGLLPTLGDTRSSPHPSVVALGCLDVRGERGEQSRY
jgi:hypothetical protein